MKQIFCLLSLFLLIASSSYSQKSKFNPEGNYEFDNPRGREYQYNPSGFEQFNFELETTEWRSSMGRSVPIKPRGTVWDGRGYKMTQISIKDRSFSFKTETIGGISYQFSGTFLKSGDFAALDLDGEVLLKGLLIKIRNGKEVARTDRRYYWWINRH